MVTRRRWVLPVVAGLAVLAALYAWMQGRPPDPVSAPVRAGERPRNSPDPGLPRIDLSRLESPRPEGGVGQRDLFEFPPPPTQPTPEPTPEPDPTPPPPPPPPTPTPLPPLNVKYVGTVAGPGGVQAAVFMTDRKEVLYGRVGDVVMNRFTVARIGLESVDVQEIGSDQTRRIPLKGN